jgi:hypothetical protein
LIDKTSSIQDVSISSRNVFIHKHD